MLSLGRAEIEQAFVQVAVDLHEIIVIDGIDLSPAGFRIRAHDLHGPLPVIEIKNNNDGRQEILETINREACRLHAIARIRNRLSEIVSGIQFLAPTLTGTGVLVGLNGEDPQRMIFAEGSNFLEAYQALLQRV